MPRTLVIGDIHGCYRAFDTLLAFVDLQPADTLITLGDYVDRGPQSWQVLERLIALKQTHNLVALRGNHECLMLGARDNPATTRHWMISGGAETLDSYNVLCGRLAQVSDIPEQHWLFLRDELQLYFETDKTIFVHGGVDPKLPMAEQPEGLLYWQRYDNECEGHCSGKLVVCGHELQPSGLPATNGKAICIDTGAWKNGWLTCLDVDTREVLQANDAGKTRSVFLEC